MPFKNIIPPTASFVNAVAEMTDAANALIPMVFAEDWLEKYQWHYDQFSLPPLPGYEDESVCTFHDLYYCFSEIAGYYRLNAICENAVQEYNGIVGLDVSIQGNVALKEWVREYEKIGMENLVLFPIRNGDANIVRTIADTIYVISYEEFNGLNAFIPIFNNLFWEEKILPESIAEMERQ